MTNGETRPVVVGIDGSNAAIDTALWAIGEAVARDVPLRLVCAANTTRTQGEWELAGPEAEYGRTSLRAASAAVEAAGESVKVETELLWGPPANALIDESQHAAMVCIGTVGIGAVARAILGSTAAAVAEHAHCPVAVIRPPDGAHAATENWVAVGITGQPETDLAMRTALEEARIRHAPLIAVGLGCNEFGVNTVEQTERRVEGWRQRYPDVAIDVVGAHGGFPEYLAEQRDELSRRYASAADATGKDHAHPLAVLDSADASQVPEIVGPHDHPLRDHARCSVLVAR